MPSAPRDEATETLLTKEEIAAIETLDAARPRDRILINLFHRLVYPRQG